MDIEMNQSRGFTLIELMAVIAIVSILAVVAITAYSDYATRAKVSEGLGFAAAAKTQVTEAYYSRNIMPTNNTMAGLADPNSFNALDHVRKLEVGSLPVPGTITITYKIPNLGADNLLQLIPDTRDGDIEWTCVPAQSNGIADNRVPANCRS